MTVITELFKVRGGQRPIKFYDRVEESYKHKKAPDMLRVMRPNEALKCGLYHLANATVVINPESSKRTVEITGEDDARKYAKLRLEDITKMRLEEGHFGSW